MIDYGITLLNEYFGGDSWKQQINIEILDMSNCYTCILGQLFGDLWKGSEKLSSIPLEEEAEKCLIDEAYDTYSDWGEYYGFFKKNEEEYASLTEDWRWFLNRT